ncbi:MAG: 7,8-didemethyl-8-hydroxy-5-deazariboflavin synthase CofG [Pseudomonadota bacterium]
MSALEGAVARAGSGTSLSDEEALALAETGVPRGALLAAARSVRDRAFGRVVTFSPKVFLPLTNLCRNRCDYCSFRRSPGEPGEWTMRPHEVETRLERARATGCSEALFCLGDTPETAFPSYRQTLSDLGHASTVDYLHWSARQALARGLLPHTNAGVLGVSAMARLRTVNVSLGLMLESTSERLCRPGMPHYRAPDKRPEKRLRMLEAAGVLRIPFTTGILVGIGETRRERVESLLAIRRLHRAHGHIQEVIVQNFRAGPTTPMAAAPEPTEAVVTETVALARILLDPDVSLQAPPNLNPTSLAALLDAGIDDLGGISPLTPDYVNPRHPWPHLAALERTCTTLGFRLRPRAPIHDRFVRSEWLDTALLAPTRAVQARLRSIERVADLVPREEVSA